jgi:hypothetical protein
MKTLLAATTVFVTLTAPNLASAETALRCAFCTIELPVDSASPLLQANFAGCTADAFASKSDAIKFTPRGDQSAGETVPADHHQTLRT